MRLTLSLTHQCNLACSYCYAGRSAAISMDKKTITQALSALIPYVSNTLDLGFFGGEPLLAWEMLRYAVMQAEELCKDKKLSLRKTVTTNGTLLTPSHMRWFKENNVVVAVSVDGNKPAHDCCRRYPDGRSSFQDCLTGLTTARQIYPDLEAIMVVTPRNLAYFNESITFLVQQNGIRRITVNLDFYTHWSPSDLTRLQSAMKNASEYFIQCYRRDTPLYLSFIDNKIIASIKGGLSGDDLCAFGTEQFAIAPSGRVYPCERLIGTDQGDGLVLGNIFDGWTPQKATPSENTHRCTNRECLSCSVEPICQRHCGCINYSLTGQSNTTHSLVCYYERESAACALRAGSLLFEEGNSCFINRFYGESV